MHSSENIVVEGTGALVKEEVDFLIWKSAILCLENYNRTKTVP